jgi:predicted DNA binding CopG/RHH family protein
MTAAGKSNQGKPIPHFNSDEELEHFVDTADLSEYDLSGFVPTKLVFRDRLAHLDLELPRTQLSAVEAAANKQGVSSDQFIRDAIDNALKKAS